jgi:hypothetical protein
VSDDPKPEPAPAPPPAAGRPSAVNPQVKLERRVPPFYAAFFYGFLAIAGYVWLWAIGGDVTALFALKNPWLEIGLGVGAGVLIVGACAVLPAWFGMARELEKEFGWILGEQKKWEIAVLAVLSGIAEEFFFRGAMQQAVGPLLATVIFGVLHWPVNWSFRLWPFFAAAAGAVLAMERHVTGGLVAPILTHVIVNAVNLTRITRAYRVWRD